MKGYFLYRIFSKGQEEEYYVYPHKIYSTLQGAKNAKIIKTYPNLKNSVWAIVPIKNSYDKESKIKYMRIDGQWKTELDEKIENEFYKWNRREI